MMRVGGKLKLDCSMALGKSKGFSRKGLLVEEQCTGE